MRRVQDRSQAPLVNGGSCGISVLFVVNLFVVNVETLLGCRCNGWWGVDRRHPCVATCLQVCTWDLATAAGASCPPPDWESSLRAAILPWITLAAAATEPRVPILDSYRICWDIGFRPAFNRNATSGFAATPSIPFSPRTERQ